MGVEARPAVPVEGICIRIVSHSFLSQICRVRVGMEQPMLRVSLQGGIGRGMAESGRCWSTWRGAGDTPRVSGPSAKLLTPF